MSKQPQPEDTAPPLQVPLSDAVADQSLYITPPPPPPPPPPYTDKLNVASSSPSTTPKPTPPRPRLCSILAAISAVLFICSIYISDQRRAYGSELQPATGGNLDVWSYRQNKPLNFGADKYLAERLGLKLAEDVPAEKVPGVGRKLKNGEDHGRVIVVGDVHGMFHELVSLLAKVKFNAASDYLILAGDLISKGPDSLKVLDLARNHGAGCVRGNHEDRILLHYHQLQKDKKKKEPKKPKGHKKSRMSQKVYNADLEDDMELDDNMEMDEMEMDDMEMDDEEQGYSTHQKLARDDYKYELERESAPFETSQFRTDQKLARKLTRKQVAWLDACPLVLRMKAVSNIGQVEVVHAGLVHGVNLEDQDPNAIMNMRTLDRRYHLPTDRTDGRHWANLWNHEEKKMEKGGEHTTVIYGHYAAMGLDIRPYTKGLDSNCVRGGRLSAFVISSKHQEVVSVRCRNYLKG